MCKCVMGKGCFIIGTGTDVGKTYVTGLLAKYIQKQGYTCGYYKAALSGADSIEESDAGYVRRFAALKQKEETLLSYLYQNPVSPHLAAKIEGNPVNLEKVFEDYQKVSSIYEYVLVEGSGGIVCPIRWDEKNKILLEDIIKALAIPTILVADAGLGSINATVLTVEYLRSRNIPVLGVILNRDKKGILEDDNVKMIQSLAQIPVLARVAQNQKELQSGDILKIAEIP